MAAKKPKSKQGDELLKLLTSVVNRAMKNGAPALVNQPVKKAAKKAASPKVQQQLARSMTKRRAMAKTEKMATKYYGK
jgi:4-hydroxy-L-threonine phosphate dehydrogenase PdxA